MAVGQPLELTARVSDDGLPEPRPDRTHLAKLMAGWLVYRGDDRHVTFDPPQFNPDLRRRAGASPLCQGIEAVPEWAATLLTPDGELSTTATFSDAGNLRAAGPGPRHRAEVLPRSHRHRHRTVGPAGPGPAPQARSHSGSA